MYTVKRRQGKNELKQAGQMEAPSEWWKEEEEDRDRDGRTGCVIGISVTWRIHENKR